MTEADPTSSLEVNARQDQKHSSAARCVVRGAQLLRPFALMVGANVKLVNGRGQAYVVWDSGPDEEFIARHPDQIASWDPPHYLCHHEPEGGDEAEYGPTTESLDDALEWARQRADEVYVRPRWDPAHYYLAGTAPPEDWPLVP